MPDLRDVNLEEDRNKKLKIPELVEISNALGVDIMKIEKIPYRKNLSTDKFQDVYSINDKIISNTRLEVKINNESIFSKYNLNFRRCSFKRLSITAKRDIKQLRFDDCCFDRVALDYCCCEKLELWQCDIKLLLLRECKFLGDFILKSKYDFDNSDDNRTVSLDDLNIIYTKFKGKCNFSGDIFKKLNLSHCVFKDDVDFSGCTFGTEVDIEKTIDLSSITFEKNANFDESVFNHFVAFHTTSFKGTASFYKCKFYTIPNFSPADFKGILNINNVVWGEKNKGFGFKNVKELVEKAYSGNDTMENVINLRSSFSSMKHKLIEQDNLLDAQNFHKAELYCKEIELKKIERKSTKEWVEWVLLAFYRRTSEHHTNLDKILHITLIVIVSYGVAIWVLYCVPICSLNIVAGFLVASFCFVYFVVVLFILYEIKNKCFNYVFRFVIYAGIFAILLCEPQIINPVLGITSSNECKNTNLNEVICDARQSMGVIYLLLLVLCIFSLQKTARKNTIVPS